MNEVCVSASEFRVHLKDLANKVAAGGQRVLVSRHGYQMVAMVSQEDLEFLRKHRPGTDAAPVKVKPPEIPEFLEHPESMPFPEVERLYRITKGLKEDRIVRWREKAWLHIRLRTGEYPDDPPYWFLS
ncbi:MAG TPA: type II toxin-antitoxin system Phd/YefM family antitoxin [Myxococcales bacterium]|nr:type II toxin-antitoxin system Phd/YefM family antitoxin [Myxococcales bacterium]